MSEITKSSGEENWDHALFVGSLSPNTTELSITRYFSKFGEVKKVKIIVDWLTNTSKDCALVFFESKEACEQIVKTSEHEIEGQKIRVLPADRRKQNNKPNQEQSSALLVRNIKPELENSEVFDYFSGFGVISSSKFSKPKQTNSGLKSAVLRFQELSSIADILDKGANHIINGVSVCCSLLNDLDYLPSLGSTPKITAGNNFPNRTSPLRKSPQSVASPAKLSIVETPQTRDTSRRFDQSSLYNQEKTSKVHAPQVNVSVLGPFITPQVAPVGHGTRLSALQGMPLFSFMDSSTPQRPQNKSFVLAVEYEDDGLFSIFCKQSNNKDVFNLGPYKTCKKSTTFHEDFRRGK